VNELQVRHSAAVTGPETVVVRLFHTSGPGEPYSEYRSVLCKFIYAALQGLPYKVFLDHHRTSSYIDDTARTLAAIQSQFKPGATYNIAGERYHDIKSISDLILKIVGRDDSLVEYVKHEAHNTRDKKTSAARAKADLGHHETVALEEGIARTIAWQREFYGVGR
jgi:dTDP-glucose 4,6-dehydratase